jgi:hypothetical protein
MSVLILHSVCGRSWGCYRTGAACELLTFRNLVNLSIVALSQDSFEHGRHLKGILHIKIEAYKNDKINPYKSSLLPRQ